MFTNARDITIEGGSFTNVEGDYHSHHHSHIHGADARQIALDKLLRHVATGAFHNSEERYDAPKCHPRTRESITKEIMEWATNPATRHLFLWLYGPAGSGKSAIVQTIAELCLQAGILAASFFFSRTAPMRNEKTYFISSIAYQLISSIPEIAGYVLDAIINDPTIFSLSISTQIDLLIIRPLTAASLQISGFRRAMIVLIDGVDECDGHNARSAVLDPLLQAVQRFHIPVYFLIASRPEQDIRDTFQSNSTINQVFGLALDANYQPDVDIKIFLQDKFNDVRKMHPLKRYIPKDWPSAHIISHLVTKASGQFIYASTVIKFVESPRFRPLDRLDIVLGMSPSGNHTPFAELDALYSGILESILPECISRVLDVFAYLILHSALDYLADLTTSSVEKILGYQPGDLQIILMDLHALIKIPEEGIDTLFQLHHASMADYLFDQSRSGKFFIDYKKAHAHIASKTIRCLSKLPGNMLGPPHILLSVLSHARRSELTEELIESLHGLDVVTTVGDLDGQTDVRPRVYSELATELDYFFRWLSNERDRDPSSSLFQDQSRMFFNWLANTMQALPNVIHDDLCATFALLLVYREVRLLEITERVHKVHISSARDRFVLWISTDSYMNSLMSTFATSASPTAFLVNGKTYAKLGCTMCAFLVDSRNEEWSFYCDSALDALLCILPKADKTSALELMLRKFLMSLQFSNEDRFVMGGSKRAQWKSRLTKVAIKCLDYMKRNHIPYSQHHHERLYELCVWCDALKEVEKAGSHSGIPPGLRLKKKF